MRDRHRLFAAWLRRCRESRRLSGREAAERAGISPIYWSRLENGHNLPSEEYMERIARALGVSIETVREAAGLRPLTGESDDLDLMELQLHYRLLDSHRRRRLVEVARIIASI